MDDWHVLASPKGKGFEERLRALERICRGDESAVDVLCVAFVEEVVATGKLARALSRAAKRARSPGAAVPTHPETGGAGARGPTKLDLDPYEAREALPLVLAALARRSFATPRLTRWLFEAVKLWSYERKRALAALDRARVEPGDLAAGIEELVAFAAARPDPGGKILRDLAVASAGRSRWLLALLERLAAEPAAAAVAADGLYGDDLDGCEVADAGARPRLLELAAGAPSGARALALEALGQLDAAGDLEPLVVTALDDAAAHPRAIDAAARLALRHQVLTRAVIDAAERRARALERVRGDRTVGEVIESLRALIDSGLGVLAPPRSLVTDRVSIVEGDLRLVSVAVVGELAVAGYRRVLVAAPSSDRRTDEDEVGVAVVGSGVAALHAAPVRLASRLGGGFGSRRAIELAGVLDQRVIVVIGSPFCDDRGWGNEHYALGCEPRSGAWVAYREDAGRLAVATALADTVNESDLPRICYGEAIVWIEGDGARVVVDATPYHLDDWELDEEVRAAQTRRDAAREQVAWRPHRLTHEEARVMEEELTAIWSAHDHAGDALDATAITWDHHVAQTLRRGTPPRRAALIWQRRALPGRDADGRRRVD